MASYHGNSHSEPAKVEQIITEFFAKSLHIILESRCPYVSSRNYSGERVLSSPSSSSSSSSSVRSRDKWFNLALRDCPAALENIDFWRQSNLEPMVVNVVLVQRPHNWDYVNSSPRLALDRNLSSKEHGQFAWTSDSDEFGCDWNSGKVIERWVVQYESRKGCREGGAGSRRSSFTSSQTLYKKLILLLRSLYVTVRLLPAFKIFRDLNSSGQIRMFNLIHRVSSFVEPLIHSDEVEMQRFVFAPVDTSCGKLCVSVSYRPSISDACSEPTTPLSPQFIPDYVGSPMADPLKRLPSMPVPQCSPSSSPFARRHSWSYDISRASPPSALASPSPTYSESRASFSRYCSNRPPPTSLRRPSLETVQVQTKDMSYDEYWPSPIFSPSPSPSPPMYIPGDNTPKVLLRSDSAPVNIPASRLRDTPLSSDKKPLLPSPPIKATRPCISEVERNSRALRIGSTVEKLLSFGKEEIGRVSGVKISSNTSPEKSFSRSSSRLSFEDNYDGSEFSGPFIVDDDDITDPSSRPGSFDRPGCPDRQNERGGSFPFRKSQAAEVGAFVQVLNKAYPLQRNLTRSQNLSQGSLCNPTHEQPLQEANASSMTSSGVFMMKVEDEVSEKLSGYKFMKQLLLREAGTT